MTEKCQGKYERQAQAQGVPFVAGVDEVGRLALLGPEFAAAVVVFLAGPTGVSLGSN